MNINLVAKFAELLQMSCALCFGICRLAFKVVAKATWRTGSGIRNTTLCRCDSHGLQLQQVVRFQLHSRSFFALLECLEPREVG